MAAADRIKTSTALVLYNPALPHISVKAYLEGAADQVARRSLKIAKLESKHLGLTHRLIHLVQHLPKLIPFSFSGVIAFQAGEGPIVQASHCPRQAIFTADQSFNVLSVGKLFTATAVMQLIEDGIEVEGEKLSLKTPLNKLLTSDEVDLPLKTPYLEHKPDVASLEQLKKHGGEVTLEHLLSHTAGFIPGPEDKDCPGESWNRNHIGRYCYSSYGYQLLARIIGKYAKREIVGDHEANFRAHIENRIFKPAGMKGAIRELHSLSKNKLCCFRISPDGKPELVMAPEPYPHGNGCWRMTASDLLAFGRAIHQPRLLVQEETFKLMQERRLGFRVDHCEDGAISGYGHPGGGPGMSSFFNVWRTEPPIMAALLSNYSECSRVKPELDPLINVS